VSRSLQDHSFSSISSRHFEAPRANSRTMKGDAAKITALHIEFVAKPSEAHKVHAALPPAINGALGGVSGFAGSLVMISNYEARLVTVVTLWSGADQTQSCNENVRWVRALLTPYLDRCLRIQTLAAYVPLETQISVQSAETGREEASEIGQNEEAAEIWAA